MMHSVKKNCDMAADDPRLVLAYRLITWRKSPVMKRAETITKEAIVQMSARLKPNCPPTMMR
jgi:hypothetical protein